MLAAVIETIAFQTTDETNEEKKINKNKKHLVTKKYLIQNLKVFNFII